VKLLGAKFKYRNTHYKNPENIFYIGFKDELLVNPTTVSDKKKMLYGESISYDYLRT
jgi:hypothetical protein